MPLYRREAGEGEPVLFVHGNLHGNLSDGTPCAPDFAGSGGGAANPDLVELMREDDRTGAYQERVMAGTGHFSYVQRPDEFAAMVHAHLAG